MVQENEAITLLLGVMTCAFVFAKRKEAFALRESKAVLIAFGLALLAWIATVAEGIALPKTFNIIEHIAYAASSVVIAYWCWNAEWKQEGPAPR